MPVGPTTLPRRDYEGRPLLVLNWLEKSYQHHDYWMLYINVDPEYDALRSDPRFQAIIHRLGVG